jgi:integrase
VARLFDASPSPPSAKPRQRAPDSERRPLGAVAHGRDPAGEKTSERGAPTVAELADRFMAEHVAPKRKPGTADFYRHLLDKIIRPELGAMKVDKLTRATVAKLHGKLNATPFQANRILAVIDSMYAFAGRAGIVPDGTNPARKIENFAEHRRERFLTGDELERLGAAIREAETAGIPWEVNEDAPKAKHIAKPESRFTKIGPQAAAALRLLLFTGCGHARLHHCIRDKGSVASPLSP